jgi:hypothetical protein
MLAGDVLLELLEANRGRGGTGGGEDIPLLNGDWLKLGLNPVNSERVVGQLDITSSQVTYGFAMEGSDRLAIGSLQRASQSVGT